MRSLSLDDARRRAALLDVTGYDVSLDLTGDETTFGSRTAVRFTARERADTWFDVRPRVLRSAVLDGRPLDVAALSGGRLPFEVDAGEHELVVEAEMAYRHDGEGLHRAVDPADGLPYTYAMSFLDAAPTVFGCFDQPDLKAPFTLHVAAPPSWLVVGNGRAEQVEPGRWELATTPPLSTYFVTLVAGPYHQVTDEHDGIRLGLECRRSLAPYLDRDAEELLTVTRQCFDEFHRLFGVRYAFGDYHQAFVPEYNAGAMENPGCVTFRDQLVFASRVTRSERTSRASTIAHEMAHQWFGDLVTMRWWDDLWLNESFAEYMGNRVTHDATEFDGVWVDAGYTRRRWGLRADQRSSTHPVAGNGAADAASALQNFDGISYAKGAAVLKQLNSRLGDDVFLRGVRSHFDRHRFGNAEMADLFEAWKDAGAVDLDAWTEQWLRVPGVDRIALDRGSHTLVRETPAEHPADRTHTFAVASYDGSAWTTTPVTVAAAATPAPEVDERPVVLDPAEESWARYGLDPLTLDALPELLPAMSDPVMRSSVWNAVRDGLTNATLDPEVALRLLETALPAESADVAVRVLGLLGLTQVVDRLAADPVAARARVHAAARARLASAEPGSDLQLAAARVVVGSADDPAPLQAWLRDDALPAGLTVDLDLRWRVLVRLAVLDAVTRDELDGWLDRERTAESRRYHVQCRASYPDPEAKRYAWRLFSGEEDASIYELQGAAAGLWQRGHEELTAEYVDRYFVDVPGTAQVRQGMLLADIGARFFPWVAISERTLEKADRLLADPDLEPGLRRAVVDAADDMRLDLASRTTFWPRV